MCLEDFCSGSGVNEPWTGLEYLIPVPYERLLLSGLLFLGGISCILITAIPQHSNIVSFAGKFFISGAYSISYLVSAEIFPTSIRNAGLGLCSVMARVGSILCPYVLITKGEILAEASTYREIYDIYFQNFGSQCR